MTIEKIDAKLRAEMERLERAGQADQPIAVVIEPAAADRAGGAATDDARARASREHVRGRLTAMGVKEVRELALANALVCQLTPAQIRTLSADSHVKRIFRDAPEKVTLG